MGPETMTSNDDDYITTHFYITCSCGNTKAYVWFDKRIREYLISCDDCGVKEVGGPEQ